VPTDAAPLFSNTGNNNNSGNNTPPAIKVPEVDNTLFIEKEYELNMMAYELKKMYKEYYKTALRDLYTAEQIFNIIDENLINKTNEYQKVLDTVTPDEKKYLERSISESHPDHGWQRTVWLEMNRFYVNNIKNSALTELAGLSNYTDKNNVNANTMIDYIALSGNKAWLEVFPYIKDWMITYSFTGTYDGVDYSKTSVTLPTGKRKRGITYRQLIDKIIKNKTGKVAQSEIDNYIEIKHILIERGAPPKMKSTLFGKRVADPNNARFVPKRNTNVEGGSRKKRNSKTKKSKKSKKSRKNI